MFDNLTLDQLRERARLNGLRGIAVSRELRQEILTRERAADRLVTYPVRRSDGRVVHVTVPPSDNY